MGDIAAPQPRRTLSRESLAVDPPRKTSTQSAFADFLSDGSNSSDEAEDEDDADSRKLLRMQQQADDSAYSEEAAAALKLQSNNDNNSFRLTLQRPIDDGDLAGPQKLLDPMAVKVVKPQVEPAVAYEGASVDDVMDLVSKVERASRVVDDHLGVSTRVDDATIVVEEVAEPKRKTSVRETESSAFADFLSDGSNSSDEEDEDDADTRKLLRMQQQADDRAYLDTSLKMERPPTVVTESDSNDNSFRLTLAKPGVFAGSEDDGWSGPKKFVEKAKARESGVEFGGGDKVESSSFEDESPSFTDANSFSTAPCVSLDDVDAAKRGSGDLHDSLASRPPSFEDEEGDSFFEERPPSFSDEPSFTGGDSFTAVDNSFVKRPSLPDDDEETENKVEDQGQDTSKSSDVYRPSLPDKNVEVKLGEHDEVQPASTDDAKDSTTLPGNVTETEAPDTASSDASAAVDTSFVYRPTLPENADDIQDQVLDDTHKVSSNTAVAVENSFVYRPTLPDDDDAPGVVFGYTHVASTNSSTTEDTSFVYRPSLPSTYNETQGGALKDTKATEEAVVVQEESKIDESPSASGDEHEDDDQPSFLSPSAASFIRSSDRAAFKFDDVDSSFRLRDADTEAVVAGDNNRVLTDNCAPDSPSMADTTQDPDVGKAGADEAVVIAPTEKDEDKPAPAATGSSSSTATSGSATPAPPAMPTDLGSDGTSTQASKPTTANSHAPVENIASMLPLSRQLSAASSTGSSQDFVGLQRRMTATRESWRVSSLDFRESKHAFDEELAPLASHPLSPRASAVESEKQTHRLSSTFEERASGVSNSSSFASQANFFVDDIQRSFSSASSLSLDSRPSGDDSFANVAILGDDGRDQNERRSSDIISQDVGELRSSSISSTFPTVPETLDRSYSDLVDVTAGLDQSFSNLVDRDAVDGDRSAANDSAHGTSLVSSLASSAVSQSSAASDELSFVSFNVVKPPPTAGPAHLQKKQAAPRSAGPEKPASESGRVFYRSIGHSRGSDAKEVKPSRSPSSYSTGATTFSSAALLAAIKTRDARTNTQSEETEAGDVALGALPPLTPPLKITLAPRGRGSLSSSLLSKSAESSPSISASPLAISSMPRSSVASSTGTADRLDFTGVYRGSVNSLEASRNNGIPSTAAQPQIEEKAKQNNQDELKEMVKFEALAVKLERSISDSRMMQRESRLKVEEFFKRTYHKSVADNDEQEVHRLPNRKTRARTTVIQCVDDVEEMPRSFAFNGNNVPKVIDLKNLRNGGKRPGWHLEGDIREENSSNQRAMGMTVGTSSTGTTATRSMPSDLIPMQPNYVISPEAGHVQQPKVLQKKKKVQVPKAIAGASGGGGFFAVSSGPGGDNVSRFGAVGGRRADNVSLTPTLPRLSANESPAFSTSPFVASFATPNGFGQSGIDRSPGKSPVGFAATASGFLWKTGSKVNGLKESAAEPPFGASRASFSQRPTLADRVQSLSASLASTLRRLLPSRDVQQNDNGEVTSPQSQCTAPAALPRSYDHDEFYETPFKVPGLNKPFPQHRKTKELESDRAWVRQWLVLATCAVLGLSLGAILVRVVVFNASVFNLSSDEVRERQESNGQLVFGAGTRWMLLPGHIFVRVWSAVTTPLVVCYVVTALADLVGCADKAVLVLSFRSIGYALLLALLATVEGVFAMWMTHHFGWFRGESSMASAEAVALSDAIGVTSLPEGAVGLLCADEGEYLQSLGHDVFACSNASLTLPLYEEISTNSTGITDSGPAVFALQEVTNVLAAPTAATPYYPASFGSGVNMTTSLLSTLTPDNVASQYTEVAADEMALLGGLIMFAMLLGYVCGKRILRLRRNAQAAMFESVRSTAEDPHKSRHYIVGLLMELQLALEWLVRPMERYVAPVGFFSLMLGHVVAHHREWRSFTSPMPSLIIGVLTLVVLHAVVVLPIVVKQLLSSRRRLPVLTTTRAFVPAFLFAFTTDNIALSAPVTMQCYARVQTVTRSAAQLVTAITAAFSRNAHALYLPLSLLWLLETSSPEEILLSTSDYFSVGLLSLLSCFCGGNTRLALAITRTLWSITVSNQSSSGASLLSSTVPLLVVCDVILSRIASVVTVADHLVLTQLTAQHWAETVVAGPTPNSSDNSVAGPNPPAFSLDDSQVPRPSSSALLSSVYL